LQWKYSVTCALGDLVLLPHERVHEIRYEELVKGPDALLKLIVALGLPDRDVILAAHAMSLETGNSGRWCNMPDRERKQMDDIIGPTLRDLGYATP
jgi:DNA-binding cell septation regulator SpoVG